LALCFAIVLPTATARADNAVERVRRQETLMSYLDNGIVRLGVDLHVGGSITYLSRSSSTDNLVNSFDFGRQIQMSYYSGPVPFVPDGKEPKSEWKFIGWNPIQVGDAFGNPSKVLEHRNDGKSIHVKCIPMHWPLDDVPGECTYECWFELEGSAVHARCKLVNNRPDHTQYPARNQELPAIYTNGPWYRLMTYTGARPFTGDALTRIEKNPKEPGMWSNWMTTESWAALVDDADFGLGVYIPGVHDFGGGFAGKPGKGGPHDNPTGYIAPHPVEIIDWNIEHEYHYDLIVGSLSEIRHYVYDHVPRPAPPTYSFTTDRQGWHYANASDTGWPIAGELNIHLDGRNPQLHGPVGFWQSDDAKTIVIEAASNTSDRGGRFYWRTFSDKHFSPQNSVAAPLNGDGDYHAYRIRLDDQPGWKGPIVQVRFDPDGIGAAGDWIRLKSIRFDK